MRTVLASGMAAAGLLAANGAMAEPALPLEFGGYVRAGGGLSSEGGEQSCFQLAGAASKYRLGNECETYGEIILGTTLYEAPQGGTSLKVHTRTSFFIPADLGSADAKTDLPEAWAEVGKIGSGPFANASLWAGRRFYMRQDVHITDFFFWNNSGNGGGLENVDLGFGQLSYAYRRNSGNVKFDSTKADSVITGHELRLGGLKVNPGGELTLGVDFRFADNDDAIRAAGFDDSNGQLYNIMHTQKGFLGGFNKLALQYGRGVVANLSANAPAFGADSSDRAWRVVEQVLWEPEGSRWNGMATLVYEDQRDKQKWISIGARPTYHFDSHWSLAVDVGHDRVKPEDGDTRSLTKLTIAPQWSVGAKFMDRPSVRAFYTYAKWNDAAQKAAPAGSTLSSTGVFGSSTNGSTVGLQLETWW